MSGIAKSPEEVEHYSKCTLLAASLRNEASSSQADTQNSILGCVEFLEENEFIRYFFSLLHQSVCCLPVFLSVIFSLCLSGYGGERYLLIFYVYSDFALLKMWLISSPAKQSCIFHVIFLFWMYVIAKRFDWAWVWCIRVNLLLLCYVPCAETLFISPLLTYL